MSKIYAHATVEQLDLKVRIFGFNPYLNLIV